MAETDAICLHEFFSGKTFHSFHCSPTYASERTNVDALFGQFFQGLSCWSATT
jgi:lysozyme family protein